MIIQEKPIEVLREYANNPRNNEKAVESVAESIKQFGFRVPIVIDGENVIVAGHTRIKAAKHLGMTSVPCVVADDLTEEQVKAFRLADNKTSEFAEWDFEKLNEELAELHDMEFDMSAFGFVFNDVTDIPEEYEQRKSLADKFIVPPFSILDTRQGYWQERKKCWKGIGIQSEVGRKQNLMNSPDLPEYAQYGGDVLSGVAPQTSIFDPVLCEISYKWFCPDNGKIYDCFAGGSVRGIVAQKLGYDYHGIDLRQEQIDANNENAKQMGLNPHWYCDDSLNADKYIEDNSCDMVFSCPPYADLEVYSDDPRDISNMDYEDFCKVYAEIISVACRKLKDDRFAVFVVGDIRDKKGFYRNFVDYTKKCFNDNGCMTYNELILVEQIGTAAMRANHTFSSMRKCIKTHQNVLVFYKGNPKKIPNNFNEISVEYELDEAVIVNG